MYIREYVHVCCVGILCVCVLVHVCVCACACVYVSSCMDVVLTGESLFFVSQCALRGLPFPVTAPSIGLQ